MGCERSYEVEEKLINNSLVRVRKFREYSRERMEEAIKRLEELGPYVDKVIRERSKYE